MFQIYNCTSYAGVVPRDVTYYYWETAAIKINSLYCFFKSWSVKAFAPLGLRLYPVRNQRIVHVPQCSSKEPLASLQAALINYHLRLLVVNSRTLLKWPCAISEIPLWICNIIIYFHHLKTFVLKIRCRCFLTYSVILFLIFITT